MSPLYHGPESTNTRTRSDLTFFRQVSRLNLGCFLLSILAELKVTSKIYAKAMKAYEELVAWNYLFLTSARDCGVRFSPSPDRHQGESHRHPWLSRLGDPHSRSGSLREEIQFLPLWGIEPRFFLDVQPVTQVMHQLRCPGSVVITVGLFSLA